MEKVRIHWFRNDLRVHDNLAFQELDHDTAFLPLYIIDPREFDEHKLGFSRMGPHRMRFLLESLRDLKKSLHDLGSDLMVAEGSPEEVFGSLKKAYEVMSVRAQKEHTLYEIRDEESVEKLLPGKLHLHESFTLFHPAEIPFRLDEIPYVFTEFRKACEKQGRIREPFAVPISLPALPEGCEIEDIPAVNDYFMDVPKPSPLSAVPFQGGETAALNRLNSYFFQSENILQYKETRNGLIGPDYSSKFSLWLANGSLSPRTIYHELKTFERKVRKNSSTYWLYFELIWRDFFRFTAMKHGRFFFYPTGITGRRMSYANIGDDFQRWCAGDTGEAFVDANMRELKETGFMSNRGRQNVASFLTKDLKVDWRWGAYWFQHQLIDFDVCSNWGNWMYVAGVGNDPRHDRYFHIQKQADRYDPEGDYQYRWLEKL